MVICSATHNILPSQSSPASGDSGAGRRDRRAVTGQRRHAGAVEPAAPPALSTRYHAPVNRAAPGGTVRHVAEGSTYECRKTASIRGPSDDQNTLSGG